MIVSVRLNRIQPLCANRKKVEISSYPILDKKLR